MLTIPATAQEVRPVLEHIVCGFAQDLRYRPTDASKHGTHQIHPSMFSLGRPVGPDQAATVGPIRVDRLKPRRAAPIEGGLVTHVFAYDGGRQVTAYVPASPPEAVVFAGDGQLISQWGGYLEAAALPPTLIVGAHRTEDDDEMVRIREYSPSFDERRFRAHEAFFVDDVRAWACSRFDVVLPASRTAVCGVSASGELSLALGLRHPDIYGAVFSASPGGGYRPPDVLPAVLLRTYLVAGTLEPFFLDNATRWADALRDAGREVMMTERVGTHGDPFWQAEFVRMVAWLYSS